MMTLLLAAIPFAVLSPHSSPGQKCLGTASAPQLDHVILVVQDLRRASAPFLERGFRLKNGRLHPNNLLNRHIKFRDGSSIELMTLHGEPRGAMARRYAELLRVEEGGVYAALNIREIHSARRAATNLRLAAHQSSSGPWQFLGFPASSPAAAVFFSAGGSAANDPDSLLAHRAAVMGLEEVWLEGGPELPSLLIELGAKRCGTTRMGDGLVGERIGLGRGSIVVVPQRSGVRPRVLGVVLRAPTSRGNLFRPFPRFWIRY